MTVSNDNFAMKQSKLSYTRDNTHTRNTTDTLTETTTEENTITYSWNGFKRYAWEVRWEFVLSLIFLLLAFGQKLFSNTMSIDTQGIAQDNTSLYRSWIRLSRFGFVWLKKIAGTYWYNNALSGFLTVIFFAGVVFVWGYVFYEISRRKDSWHIAFFAIPVFVSPIMAEQLGFLLQSPSVCVGMTLVAFATMIYFNAANILTAYMHDRAARHSSSRSTSHTPILYLLAYYIADIIILGAAFSLYTAQLSLFIALVGMAFVYRFFNATVEDRKANHSFINYIIIPAALTVSGYILYSLMNRFALFYYHTETDDYVNDQVRWGKDTLGQIARSIVKHAYSMYTGQRIYYSLAFTILGLVIVLALFIRVFLKKTPLSAALVGIAVYISPLLMTVLLGGAPSIRTEYVYPFVFGFMFLIGHELLTDQRWGKIKLTQAIAWLLLLCVGFTQGQISNRIFYTEAVIYQQDVLLASQLAQRIEEAAGTEHPEEPVVYIGTHFASGNADTYKPSDIDLIGRSIMEIAFSTSHGDWVKGQFMGLQGYNFKLPSAEQEHQAEQIAQTMPHWPAEGSVIKKDGIIIVNF